jgi:cation:H+ antiporter
MIFLVYLILAAGLVFLSIKAADYVDLLDKKTNLSGAFIGGVLLAAVTSLPELITTISATAFIGSPGLAMGNILGSNLFNAMVLAVLILVFTKVFINGDIARSHLQTSYCILGMYGVVALSLALPIDVEIFTISIISLLIAAFYAIGVKSMANAPSESSDEEDDNPLTLKQVIIRFALTGVLLIGVSIAVTYVTDSIATTYNLGAGLAGALFLGIATSIPEMASCIALVRKGNFNIATGNIVGSNLFNFIILVVADLFYVKGSVYQMADANTTGLLVFGLAANVLLSTILFTKTYRKGKTTHKAAFIIPSIGVILCYIAFLL